MRTSGRPMICLDALPGARSLVIRQPDATAGPRRWPAPRAAAATTCSFFCLVVAAGLTHTLARWRRSAPALRLRPRRCGSRSAMPAAMPAPPCGYCRRPRPRGRLRSRRRRERPGAGFPAGGACPCTGCARSCGRARSHVMNARQHAKRAVGFDRRVLGHLAVPYLDAVAGDRPWLVLAEGGQDVAVDHATVAIAVPGLRVSLTTSRHSSIRSATGRRAPARRSRRYRP